jgi:4-hydroxy-2-oxoheptanedioate aldolase
MADNTFPINTLREAWASGRATLNGWLNIASPFVAEMMTHGKWDSLTVDMQHGLLGYETAVGMLQAIHTRNLPALVRVPWNDPAVIMQMLDAGAQGIICPMINTRGEAEQFVGACRYAPTGFRSFGPVRAGMIYGAEYAHRANTSVVTMGMIETAQALDNVEQIAAAPGLDGLFVGPYDLGLSLFGKAAPDPDSPDMFRAYERILNAAQAHRLIVGIFTSSPEYALRMKALGFRFINMMSDTHMLTSGMNTAIERFYADSSSHREG